MSSEKTATNDAKVEGGFIKSRKKRLLLLAICGLSYFIDVLSASAFFIFTGKIAHELHIGFDQQSWIITSYAVTFASFLLFFGRVCDLYSPSIVFNAGFILLPILCLILSFLTDRYAFFVFRALQGIAGAALVPSAYRLIPAIFPPEERRFAFTLYAMIGNIANVLGTVVAGLIDYIPTEGQGASWRWFFRLITFITLPLGIGCLWIIPKTKPADSDVDVRWKRLDPVGITSVLSGLILFILSLTLGADHGFATAAFLLPFLFSLLVLFPFFFWWETRLPETHALLPPSIWKIPNLSVLIAFSLLPLGWWGVNFLPFIELFTLVHGERTILAAVRCVPEGFSAGVVNIALIAFPKLVANPRWPILCSLVFCAVAYVLWTQATSVVGVGYWRYVFPGMMIGSGGMQVVLVGINVGVMMAVPPSMAGTTGALLSTALQTSTVVALAIQAGLFTIRPGGIYNFTNVRASWYFELGWTAVWGIGFALLYKPGKNVNAHEEIQEKEEHSPA